MSSDMASSKVNDPNKRGRKKLWPFTSQSQESHIVAPITSCLSEVSPSRQSTFKGNESGFPFEGRGIEESVCIV